MKIIVNIINVILALFDRALDMLFDLFLLIIAASVTTMVVAFAYHFTMDMIK